MSTTQVMQAAPAAPLMAAVTTNQIFALLTANSPGVNAAASSQACLLNILGSKRLEAKKFLVRTSGVCTSVGASTTFSPFLAVGSSLTIGNDTIIAQATGVTVNTTSCPWFLEANLIFDSLSGKLQGYFTSCINGTVGAAQSLSANITGLNGNNEPVFSLVAGGQFSAGAAGNIITLSEFVLVE